MKGISLLAVSTLFLLTACKSTTVAKADSQLPPPLKREVVSVEYLQKGKSVYENSCGKCHQLHDPANYDDQKWLAILDVMAPKAKLNKEEKSMVYSYLISTR